MTRSQIMAGFGAFAMALAFAEPMYVHDQMPLLDLLFKTVRIGCFLLVVWNVVRAPGVLSNPLLVLSIALGLWVAMDGFLFHDGGDVTAQVFAPIYVITIIAYFCLVERDPCQRDLVVRGYWLPYALLVVANLVSIVLFPDGLYSRESVSGGSVDAYWLLGHKNRIYGYYLCFLFLTLILPIEKRFARPLRVVSIGIVGLSLALAPSGTGVICYGVFCAMYFTRLYKSRLFNWKTIVLTYVGLFCVIMFTRDSEMIAAWTDSMGKDITFTGRTFIWDAHMDMIPDHWWLGHGWLPGETRADLVPEAFGAVEAHNTILELLFDYGMPGLLLWSTLIVAAFVKMNKSCSCKEIGSMGMLVVSCYLVSTLVESKVFDCPMFVVVALACTEILKRQGASDYVS